MTGPCCTGEGSCRRLARRFSGAAALALPATAWVLLPKCPLCLAAWLAVATGIGISATAAAQVRMVMVVLWIVAVAVVAVRVIRRSGS